jgi:hypothetical protein
MSNKKLNIMSLSMDPDMQDKLKRFATQKEVSVSKLVRDLVDKYLVSEEDVVPVIIKIPLHLKGDAENLQKWLDAKTAALVQALCG